MNKHEANSIIQLLDLLECFNLRYGGVDIQAIDKRSVIRLIQAFITEEDNNE